MPFQRKSGIRIVWSEARFVRQDDAPFARSVRGKVMPASQENFLRHPRQGRYDFTAARLPAAL